MDRSDQANRLVFRSLVERSIDAWHSINYVGTEGYDGPGFGESAEVAKRTHAAANKVTAIQNHADILGGIDSLDSLLVEQGYWFFQLRDAFLRQKCFTKWSAGRLDDYILLPIDYGFANNEDCYFVSHFWRAKHHPDEHGNDLRLVQEDLASLDWRYIWVDWTCMPQGDDKGVRSDKEKAYFKKMLRCIPMLIRDCAFEWRFPSFEPRAWILYEVAEYVLNHEDHIKTEDNRTYIQHLAEMARDGVDEVVARYDYKCTNDSDKTLVIGWISVLVILARTVPDVSERQAIFDWINKGEVGSMTVPDLGLTIDKARGIVRTRDETFHFNPVFLSGATT
ncbi:hypothetical protein DL768_006335 [Monosporascus sp. mg162]|nr:hypothetical protein DL768_006335 [Monosporascus sp. mg162]